MTNLKRRRSYASNLVHLTIFGLLISAISLFISSCKKSSSIIEEPSNSKSAKKTNGFGDMEEYHCDVSTQRMYKTRRDSITHELKFITVDVPVEVCYSGAQRPGGSGSITFDPNNQPSSTNWTSASRVLDNVAGTSISSISDYIKCFDPNQAAQITYYVTQPHMGYAAPYIGTNIGEAFLGITQGGTTRVFGFYPSGGLAPMLSLTAPGQFINKSGTSCHMYLYTNVSSDNFADVLAYINSLSSATYDFNELNNADFVINVTNLAGLPVVVSPTQFPTGTYARSAGYLGEVLRYTQINSSLIMDGGTMADYNNGTCP
jgi:hypothetical protein